VKTVSAQVQEPRHIVILRRLIWSYFFLLVFEGALRKWVMPFAANPILIIRDPIVIAAYIVAWRAGLFPRNTLVIVAAYLGLVLFVAGVIATGGNFFVAGYGWRADFLHIPFIFLIGRVLTAADVRRVGYWVLLIAIPMALLMVVQFRSPANSWINAGSDENFKQIASAMGRIRAPGTFSFIVGPVYYFTLVTVFLLYSQYKSRYPLWLTMTSTAALLMALAISGSRSMVMSVAIVLVTAITICAVVKPVLALRWIGSLAIVGVLALGIADTPIAREGLDVFSTRVSNAGKAEGGAEGFLHRFVTDFTSAGPAFFESPEIGYGLGMGTNVGAVLVSGKAQFLLAEAEWPRLVFESGPVLGLLLIVFRVWLAIWVGVQCIRYAAAKDPLPVLLISATFLGILNGPFGQPTVLGFAVSISGLALAAMRVPRVRGVSHSSPSRLPEETGKSAGHLPLNLSPL
jgi:hypothetical protein